MIGETIAHYYVTAKIGEGGMGEVYRATDIKLHRDVAIKVLPQSFAKDAERMARFILFQPSNYRLWFALFAVIRGEFFNDAVLERWCIL
jgi:serine/threonine protein kinase